MNINYKTTDYTKDGAKSEFYPTPAHLIEKMLNGVNWSMITNVLEPSAGKGDIAAAIESKLYSYHKNEKHTVDCIEIDANLREILKLNLDEDIHYLDKRKAHLEEKYDNKRITYDEYDKKRWDYHKRLDLATSKKKHIHIVHDDFLTFNPYKQYDLVVMNPPFSNADKHLLKAMEIQKHGGSIICILNAETIRNLYTETRKRLVSLLNDYNAEITYHKDEFLHSERRTHVEIAMVKVNIPAIDNEMSIFERLEKETYNEYEESSSAEIEVTDYIKAAINRYKLEIRSGLELIKTYKKLKPYISTTFEEKDTSCLLRLSVSGDDRSEVRVNDFVAAVRLKYWRALLKNKKFVGKLTSKLQQKYYERVSDFADYDFSEFNIHNLMLEMQAEIKSGIEEEALTMFDRLTDAHSYHKDCSKNIHLYNGWKTNKCYKLEKKTILPCYGVFSQWDGKPYGYEAYNVLSDIERVLNFFAGKMTEDVDLRCAIDNAFKKGETKVECKYFTAVFYKKGTVHITYKCPELIQRYNIFAAKNRNWLPPTYGKKAYKDMTSDEQAVVDSFQGKDAYKDVVDNAGYYLASPTTRMTLAIAG